MDEYSSSLVRNTDSYAYTLSLMSKQLLYISFYGVYVQKVFGVKIKLLFVVIMSKSLIFPLDYRFITRVVTANSNWTGDKLSGKVRLERQCPKTRIFSISWNTIY